MKTKTAIFLLTVGMFAITGCTDMQVAVDRFGCAQPGIQTYEPPVNPSVIESEIWPFFRLNNQFDTLGLFGFNDFRTGLMPMTLGLPYNFGGSLTLFNGTQLMQKPFEIVFPYNQDASLTLFRFNDFQIKIMPAMDGRF